MDHENGQHREVRSSVGLSVGRYGTDSLQVENSGISTDMLLFSEVGMAQTQHYRVYKGGLPHAVFPDGLHEPSKTSSPVTGTVRVSTGNRMYVDAEICATTTSIVATEAIVPRGSDQTESS